MWHRFDSSFRAAIQRAVARHEAGGGAALSTQTLLWGLAEEREAPAARLLARLGLTPEALRAALEETATQEEPGPAQAPGLTPAAREAVHRAYQLAAEFGDSYIGGEHLLLAFVRDAGGCDAGRILARAGMSWADVVRALMRQQDWRTSPPEGVRVSGLATRRFRRYARKTVERLRRLAYGAAHARQPFLPFLLFRERTVGRPYPFYARLRRRPFYWDTLTSQWVVTGYEDVVAALAEPRLSHRSYAASAWGGAELPPLIAREFRRLDGCLSRQMLFLDAPRPDAPAVPGRPPVHPARDRPDAGADRAGHGGTAGCRRPGGPDGRDRRPRRSHASAGHRPDARRPGGPNRAVPALVGQLHRVHQRRGHAGVRTDGASEPERADDAVRGIDPPAPGRP